MIGIFEQIKEDREVGTQGEWVKIQDHPSEETRRCVAHIRSNGEEHASNIATLYLCQIDQYDVDARRIARVPQLEKIALEAEQMRIDLLIASNNIADAAKTDPRWSGVAEILRARLTKFDEATQ